MNESELKEKWELEKPVYHAWCCFVVNSIKDSLERGGKDLSIFLKVPAECRLKETSKLVDKAFYRPDKDYGDPYAEIEDKVGARFVVLLLEEIKEIIKIVESGDEWTFDACKHFDEDKKNHPLLFAYQSVHYILRPNGKKTISDVIIPEDTPCEIQIRTLLQHAHSELTHDSVYKAKSKKNIRPEVHRTIAKSMALIETTDGFFEEVTTLLKNVALQEYNILNELDGLYYTLTGIQSHTKQSAMVIWDTFEQFIDDQLVDGIRSMLKGNSQLSDAILGRYATNGFYGQSTVLFVYWMLLSKRVVLLRDWPLRRDLLDMLGVEVGVKTTG